LSYQGTLISSVSFYHLHRLEASRIRGKSSRASSCRRGRP